MPAKKRDPTITLRIANDVHDHLGRFVEKQPDWTKGEIVSVAVHEFLASSDEDRIAALVRFRARHGDLKK